MDQPKDLSKWGWHSDYGWVQTDDTDTSITAMYYKGEAFKVTINCEPGDAEFFEDEETPINAIGKDNWPDDEDESEDLWRTVMERGQG